MRLKVLQSIPEVFEVLAWQEIAAACSANKTAVFNWKYREKFPAKTRDVITKALEARGCTAPNSLFGMQEPADVR